MPRRVHSDGCGWCIVVMQPSPAGYEPYSELRLRQLTQRHSRPSGRRTCSFTEILDSRNTSPDRVQVTSPIAMRHSIAPLSKVQKPPTPVSCKRKNIPTTTHAESWESEKVHVSNELIDSFSYSI